MFSSSALALLAAAANFSPRRAQDAQFFISRSQGQPGREKGKSIVCGQPSPHPVFRKPLPIRRACANIPNKRPNISVEGQEGRPCLGVARLRRSPYSEPFSRGRLPSDNKTIIGAGYGRLFRHHPHLRRIA